MGCGGGLIDEFAGQRRREEAYKFSHAYPVAQVGRPNPAPQSWYTTAIDLYSHSATIVSDWEEPYGQSRVI